MINASSLGVAYLYAGQLADDGVFIEPSVTESDIHEAMSLIPEHVFTDLDTLATSPDNANIVASSLEHASELYDPIVDRWAQALDTAIEVLTKVVVPVYTEYLIAAKDITDIEPDSIGSSYQIELVDTPAWFLDNPSWFTDQNRGTTPSFQALPELKLSPLSSPSVINGLNMLCSLPEAYNWLKSAIHSNLPAVKAAFDGIGSSAYLLSVFNKEDVQARINDATLLILLTKVLGEEPPNTINIDNASYHMYLRNLRLLAQHVITTARPLLDMHLKQEVLVLEQLVHLRTIRIWKHTYKTYVEKGGTADALLGLLISDRRSRSVSDVLGIQRMLTETWLAFLANDKVTSKTTQLVNAKRLLRRSVDTMRITEYEANCGALHTTVEAGDILDEHTRRTMFDYINEITDKDLGQIELTAARIIGLGRFGYLSAHEFLEDMIKAKIHCEQHDSYSALYAATRAHIVRYIARSIQQVK